jgi:putative ABC transport system permease protein
VFSNYFTTGLRQLLAAKLYAAINVIGLAVGLACALLIFLYVRHELSFDRRLADADRIYRISADYFEGNGREAWSPAPNVQPAALQLALDFPNEIEQTARIAAARVRLRVGDTVRYEDGFRYADAGFFDIFALDWIAGDRARALAEPGSVVLTESAAARYFGADDPMGQSLLLENRWPITVTGVIRDFPNDTHLSGNLIASFDAGAKLLDWDYATNWSFWNFHTYVRLKPGVAIDSLASRFEDFVARHKRPGDGVSSMTATRVTDIHLNPRPVELRAPGSMTSVKTFSAIAFCILLIACANFTNLATARGAQRAREVGVRKAMGAGRFQLAAQFLGEAALYTVAALLVAIALVELLLPAFNAFLDTPLTVDYFGDFRLVATLVALVPLVGVLAGAYPAVYLSAFEPSRVLKGDVTRGTSGVRLRAALVVAQFAISIGLLIVTAIVFQQTSFARTLERGFDTEPIVVLTGSQAEGLGPRWDALKRRLASHPEITHVIGGSMMPASAGDRSVRAEGGDPAGRTMPGKGVDFGFFETYGIELLAGRTFSEERGTDRFVVPTRATPHTAGAYVLNELAARELGWTPEQAIGKWFELDLSADFSFAVRGPVVGVVSDTYIASVREPQRPIVYFISPEVTTYDSAPFFFDASLRLTGNDLPATLEFIDAAWREIMPDQPLTREFLDARFDALSRNEERQAGVFAAFSVLAIFVASLGLIGLASFTTQQRTKEIGIRKALGGSVVDVLALLTGQFSKLVLMANLIAWPAAYFLMDDWLSTFAYRIDMSPLVFLGSSMFALAIAWITVAAIAARAAGAKPIHALRYE